MNPSNQYSAPAGGKPFDLVNSSEGRMLATKMKTLRRTNAMVIIAWCVLFVASVASLPTFAQPLVLSGTNYVQDFDGIDAGLPTGWSVWTNATASSLAGPAVFNTNRTAWLLATAGIFYNMASTDNTNWDTGQPFGPAESAATQAAATNRAPGIRLRSSTDPGAAFALCISNTLGCTNLQLSVDLLVMTTNNDRTGTWTVDYGIGATPISFTPLGYLSDVVIAGTNAFGKTNGTYTLPADVCDRGDPLWIRVALLTATGPSGARDVYGIDNFSLTWSVVPSSTNPPTITAHPESRTNQAGTTATFTVTASGSGLLYYQWRKDGMDLQDGPKISGANTSTLQVSGVVAADAGAYTVVVTNNYGTKTSEVATLTVVDPAILVHPESRTNVVGDVAKFTAQAAGTLPMAYEWRFNGTPLTGVPGATGTLADWAAKVLVLPAVQPTNQGGYSFMVSNSFGSTTSAVANLSLLPTPTVRIARWAFNSDPPDADPTTGVISPEVGSGTATAVGGTYGAFLVGSDSDPATLGTDNSGWNIKGYPPQGSANKTAGVQFDVSTVGYQDLMVTWEQQNNTRASRYFRLQYTTNGTDFTDYNVIDLGGLHGQWVLLLANLAAIPAVNNNPNFGIRIVAEFESTATGGGSAAYVATDPGATYGSTAAAVRYDVLNVFANPYGTFAPITITQIGLVGGNVRIDFTAGAGDTPASFTLQSAGVVNGPFADVSATITQLGSGVFRAERAVSGPGQFYRIRRVPN